MITRENTAISHLGPRRISSPLQRSGGAHPNDGLFVSDEARIRYRVERGVAETADEQIDFEKAGPRAELFFDPQKSKAAIVTCGGICPGLNNVIRSATFELM